MEGLIEGSIEVALDDRDDNDDDESNSQSRDERPSSTWTQVVSGKLNKGEDGSDAAHDYNQWNESSTPLSMASEQQYLEPDVPNRSGDVMSGSKENGLVLRPVSACESGQGFPYAPVDFPNPGDTWGWRVGKRKNNSGFMVDRYLYPPSRLQKSPNGRPYFASMLSVKEFVRKEFPNSDIDAFFASFSWKIPSKDHFRGKERTTISSIYPMEEMAELYGSESDVGPMACKARNKMCSLQQEARSHSILAMNCDICCTEPGFCRDCCCILCSRAIDWVYGGYSFIRCEAKVSENYICGHAAHIDCALRSYMAGTVGGTIGLDVEYYCRRCDYRTDLMSHVTRLLKTCESVDARDDIEKILKVGLCILRGSQQESAKGLLTHIELALTKLRSGIYLEDIWKKEDDIPLVSSGAMSCVGNNGSLLGTLGVTNDHCPLDFTSPHEIDCIQRKYQQPIYITSDHKIESLKLEEEIDQILQDLKKSQELEYRMAEDRLYAQKELIVDLYQQLDAERSKLARRTSSTAGCEVDAILTSILSRVNQVKEEVVKLKGMKEVAKGFGRTSAGVLKEHFGFQIED